MEILNCAKASGNSIKRLQRPLSPLGLYLPVSIQASTSQWWY